MSGGDKPPEQKTEQVLSPEQREMMNLALPGVRQFAASVPQRYQGATVAGFDPSQSAGQEQALGAAGTVGQLGGSGANTSNYWLSPSALDVNNNPAIQDAIGAATRPVYEQLSRYGLPNVRSEALSSGNFGGSRQGIAEGLAMASANQTAGDISSRIASDAYGQNVKAQLAALGLLPQTQQAQLAQATTTSGVGDVRQQQAQRLIDEQVAGYNYDQYAPFLQSKEIMSLLQGIPGGSTVSTGSIPQKNQTMSALGGAAAGASLGTAIMPGPGTAIGGLGGGLYGYFS